LSCKFAGEVCRELYLGCEFVGEKLFWGETQPSLTQPIFVRYEIIIRHFKSSDSSFSSGAATVVLLGLLINHSSVRPTGFHFRKGIRQHKFSYCCAFDIVNAQASRKVLDAIRGALPSPTRPLCLVTSERCVLCYHTNQIEHVGEGLSLMCFLKDCCMRRLFCIGTHR
jgi:hypothetical protein